MQQSIENCAYSSKYWTGFDILFGYHHLTCNHPNIDEKQKGVCWNCKLFKQKGSI